jgi:hypothetical protein
VCKDFHFSISMSITFVLRMLFSGSGQSVAATVAADVGSYP